MLFSDLESKEDHELEMLFPLFHNSYPENLNGSLTETGTATKMELLRLVRLTQLTLKKNRKYKDVII